MASYIDLMRMQHEKVSQLERRLESAHEPDSRNTPYLPVKEVAERIVEAEGIHGEKFFQPRDYVTLNLKQLQAELALDEIASDSAFNKDGRNRADLALYILTSEKMLDSDLQMSVWSLIEKAL